MFTDNSKKERTKVGLGLGYTTHCLAHHDPLILALVNCGQFIIQAILTRPNSAQTAHLPPYMKCIRVKLVNKTYY